MNPLLDVQSAPRIIGPLTCVPPTAATATAAAAANDANFLRVFGSGAISKIGLHVGASSGNVSVAVYRASGAGRGATPGTRLATSGAVACPAAGYAEISLGATVNVYDGDFFCLTVDNTTATFRPADGGYAGSSSLGAGYHYVMASAHPAPATPAGLTPVLGKVFVLAGVP